MSISLQRAPIYLFILSGKIICIRNFTHTLVVQRAFVKQQILHVKILIFFFCLVNIKVKTISCCTVTKLSSSSFLTLFRDFPDILVVNEFGLRLQKLFIITLFRCSQLIQVCLLLVIKRWVHKVCLNWPFLFTFSCPGTPSILCYSFHVGLPFTFHLLLNNF